MKKIFYILIAALLLASCGSGTVQVQPRKFSRPAFCADSAYAYIEKQMSFGPRVPNSEAHLYCRLWMAHMLQQFGAQVEVQNGTMTDYRGNDQAVFNIIGHFSLPQYADRPHILLGAHYDTRPWCDEEPNLDDRRYNVPGANDGASGVGVLMEVARQLQQRMADSTLYWPVDIVFFDVEDSGEPANYTGMERSDTWCLGSQYWSYRYAQKKTPEYQYGIILDMVGAPQAMFPLEGYSQHYAGSYQEQIWRTAEDLGYANMFSKQYGGGITDDHTYINTIAGIPCVDIIHYNPQVGFPAWWHTRQDDMQNISKETLQAVGEVVLSQL